jgi:hypothetical protein
MIYCNERVALRRVGRYQKADNTMARRKRTNNDLLKKKIERLC